MFFKTKITSRIGLATYAVLSHTLDHVLVTFLTHLLSQDVGTYIIQNEHALKLCFNDMLGSFLAQFWHPNVTKGLGAMLAPFGVHVGPHLVMFGLHFLLNFVF